MRFKNGQEFVKSLVSEYCPEPSVLNSIRLTIYFNKAHDLYYKAKDFLQAGNNARAYIELMRFAQLVMKIQEHNAYKEKTYQRDRNLNKRRLENAIVKLEELKPKIIAEYNNQIKLEEQQKLYEAQNPKPAQEEKKDSGNSNNNNNNNSDKNDAESKNESKTNDNESKTADKSQLPPNKRWGNLLPPSAPPANDDNNNNSNNNSNSNSGGKNGGGGRGWARSLDNVFNTPKKSTIHIPSDLVQGFIKIASNNTKRDIETCGVLCGKHNGANDSYSITHVIVPKQKGTANTVQTLHEEELIGIQEKYEIVQLGWIHTHPSQTCFLSSVDMHCQLSYQIMMPNGIAIVHAPTDKTQVFTLTKKGIDVLSKCNCQGFHRHETVRGLYEVAKHVNYTKSNVKFIDLRNIK